MKRKNKSGIGILAALAIAAVILTGCGRGYTEEEIAAALPELVEKSMELNEIFYGKGLPASKDAETINAFYSSFQKEAAVLNYSPVDPACGYTSENDIRRAALAVFTEEYAAVLFERAFRGVDAVFDEGTERQITQSAVPVMYLTQKGWLTVRLDLAKDALPLNRTYDTENYTVVSRKQNAVVVSVPSYVDGKPAENVKMRLVMTDAGFRLDWPTY